MRSLAGWWRLVLALGGLAAGAVVGIALAIAFSHPAGASTLPDPTGSSSVGAPVSANPPAEIAPALATVESVSTPVTQVVAPVVQSAPDPTTVLAGSAAAVAPVVSSAASQLPSPSPGPSLPPVLQRISSPLPAPLTSPLAAPLVSPLVSSPGSSSAAPSVATPPVPSVAPASQPPASVVVSPAAPIQTSQAGYGGVAPRTETVTAAPALMAPTHLVVPAPLGPPLMPSPPLPLATSASNLGESPTSAQSIGLVATLPSAALLHSVPAVAGAGVALDPPPRCLFDERSSRPG